LRLTQDDSLSRIAARFNRGSRELKRTGGEGEGPIEGEYPTSRSSDVEADRERPKRKEGRSKHDERGGGGFRPAKIDADLWS